MATFSTLLVITGLLAFCGSRADAQPFSTIPVARFGKGTCDAVAYSPDGRLMATAGSAGVVWLFDAVTLREIGCLRGHTKAVTSLAFSPDGRLIASGTVSQTVGIWDVERRQLVAWLDSPQDRRQTTRAVAFSPDGSLLVSAGVDGAIVRRVPSGEQVAMIEGTYYSAAFGPGGRPLALGGSLYVSLRDAVTTQEIASLRRDRGAEFVALGADGKLLAVATRREIGNRTTPVVEVWDLTQYHEIAAVVGATDPVAFSPDGRLLVSAGSDYAIQVWDVSQRQAVGSLAGHRDRVTSLAFGPDSRRLLSGSDDRTARVWDVSLLQETERLTAFTSAVKAAALRPDGGQLASGGFDRLSLWNVSAPNETPIAVGSAGILLAAAYSPDGSLVAWGGYDQAVHVWDLTRQEEVGTLTGFGDRVISIAFSPDGRFLASTRTNSSTVWLWDVLERREVAPLITGLGQVYSLAFSPNRGILATAGWPGQPSPWYTGPQPNIELWDLPRRSLAGSFAHRSGSHISSVAFSLDGKSLASGTWDETVHVWDIASGQVTATLDTLLELENRVGQIYTNSLAFSPEGNLLALGIGGDREAEGLYLWDVQKNKLVLRLTEQLNEITSVSFSSDGRLLASGSDDGTVFVWQAQAAVPVDDQEEPPLPTGFSLAISLPNPFRVVTAIPFGLPEATAIRLSIYDVSGQEIRKLVDGYQDAGWHHVAWDGRDTSGRPAGSGLYFCRLLARNAGTDMARKILLIR